MYLLYIDMLGVKARWQLGRIEAERAMREFDSFVVSGLADASVNVVVGGIDSDAAAFILPTLSDALRLGRAVYLSTFMSGHPINDERYWVRGVIVRADDAELRSVEPLPYEDSSLTRVVHSDALLRAICIEASGGLKGMRIIVPGDVISQAIRDEFRIKVNHGYFIPFRQFDHTTYPDSEWWDYAWMVPEDLELWSERRSRMRDRMRASGGSSHELEHAAHTRVLFDQIGAILMLQHFMER